MKGNWSMELRKEMPRLFTKMESFIKGWPEMARERGRGNLFWMGLMCMKEGSQMIIFRVKATSSF